MRVFLYVVLALMLAAVISCMSFGQKRVKVYSDPFHLDSTMVYAIPDIHPIQRIVKPAVYDRWWDEVMTCSHLSITPIVRDRIQYYAVSSQGFVTANMPDGGYLSFAGYSAVWENKMYLVFSGLADEELVKHEMLHFLMYHNGIEMGHPVPLFRGCNLRPF